MTTSDLFHEAKKHFKISHADAWSGRLSCLWVGCEFVETSLGLKCTVVIQSRCQCTRSESAKVGDECRSFKMGNSV